MSRGTEASQGRVRQSHSRGTTCRSLHSTEVRAVFPVPWQTDTQ